MELIGDLSQHLSSPWSTPGRHHEFGVFSCRSPISGATIALHFGWAHRPLRIDIFCGFEHMRRDRRSSGGFTLLEVLVALAVLAVTLGALLPVFSGALQGRADLDGERLALSCASAKLASLGNETPLADGLSEGVSPDGVKWRLEIAPYGLQTTEALLLTKRVTLTVIWTTRHHTHSLTIKSIRTAGHE